MVSHPGCKSSSIPLTGSDPARPSGHGWAGGEEKRGREEKNRCHLSSVQSRENKGDSHCHCLRLQLIITSTIKLASFSIWLGNDKQAVLLKRLFSNWGSCFPLHTFPTPLFSFASVYVTDTQPLSESIVEASILSRSEVLVWIHAYLQEMEPTSPTYKEQWRQKTVLILGLTLTTTSSFHAHSAFYYVFSLNDTQT